MSIVKIILKILLVCVTPVLLLGVLYVFFPSKKSKEDKKVFFSTKLETMKRKVLRFLRIEKLASFEAITIEQKNKKVV